MTGIQYKETLKPQSREIHEYFNTTLQHVNRISTDISYEFPEHHKRNIKCASREWIKKNRRLEYQR